MLERNLLRLRSVWHWNDTEPTLRRLPRFIGTHPIVAALSFSPVFDLLASWRFERKEF